MHNIFLFMLKTVLILPVLLIALPVFGEDYKIGSSDVLTITVYGHDELRTKDRVSDNGNITLPLIGKVQVGGLQTSQATERITSLLADGYIIRPQVSIFIDEFKSNKVILLGEIAKTGGVQLSGPTSILELITQAGGLTKTAGESVTINRIVDGEHKTIIVSLEKLFISGDLSNNIPIHGGDTVTVPASPVCYITGEVQRPDTYPCKRNTTVLKIISMAGGFTSMASESSVRINRIINGKKQILKRVKEETLVLPGDIITVPESFF